MQECIGGGAETMSLRDRILLKQEADVLIDAKAPLLLEILKWCKKESRKFEIVSTGCHS